MAKEAVKSPSLGIFKMQPAQAMADPVWCWQQSCFERVGRLGISRGPPPTHWFCDSVIPMIFVLHGSTSYFRKYLCLCAVKANKIAAYYHLLLVLSEYSKKGKHLHSLVFCLSQSKIKGRHYVWYSIHYSNYFLYFIYWLYVLPNT